MQNAQSMHSVLVDDGLLDESTDLLKECERLESLIKSDIAKHRSSERVSNAKRRLDEIEQQRKRYKVQVEVEVAIMKARLLSLFPEPLDVGQARGVIKESERSEDLLQTQKWKEMSARLELLIRVFKQDGPCFLLASYIEAFDDMIGSIFDENVASDHATSTLLSRLIEKVPCQVKVKMRNAEPISSGRTDDVVWDVVDTEQDLQIEEPSDCLSSWLISKSEQGDRDACRRFVSGRRDNVFENVSLISDALESFIDAARSTWNDKCSDLVEVDFDGDFKDGFSASARYCVQGYYFTLKPTVSDADIKRAQEALKFTRFQLLKAIRNTIAIRDNAAISDAKKLLDL